MKKIGIWLDQKEANIITLVKKKTQFNTIFSGIETRERIEGEKKQFGRFGEQYLNFEKNKKNKIEQLSKKYLSKIVNKLQDSDEFMIFGPAQCKIKLEKLIHSNPELLLKLKSVETAENMSENQKIAYVKKYFSE